MLRLASPRYTDFVHIHYPIVFLCHQYNIHRHCPQSLSHGNPMDIAPWSFFMSPIFFYVTHCSQSLSHGNPMDIAPPVVFPSQLYTRTLFTIIIQVKSIIQVTRNTDIVHSHYPMVFPMSPIHTDIVHNHDYPIVFPCHRNTWTLFTIRTSWSPIYTDIVHIFIPCLPMSPIYTDIVHIIIPCLPMSPRHMDIVHSQYLVIFLCHRYTLILFTIIIIP